MTHELTGCVEQREQLVNLEERPRWLRGRKKPLLAFADLERVALDAKKSHGLDQDTIADLEWRLGYLLGHFERFELIEIDVAAVDTFRDDLTGRSPRARQQRAPGRGGMNRERNRSVTQRPGNAAKGSAEVVPRVCSRMAGWGDRHVEVDEHSHCGLDRQEQRSRKHHAP